MSGFDGLRRWGAAKASGSELQLKKPGTVGISVRSSRRSRGDRCSLLFTFAVSCFLKTTPIFHFLCLRSCGNNKCRTFLPLSLSGFRLLLYIKIFERKIFQCKLCLNALWTRPPKPNGSAGWEQEFEVWFASCDTELRFVAVSSCWTTGTSWRHTCITQHEITPPEALPSIKRAADQFGEIHLPVLWWLFQDGSEDEKAPLHF